MKLCDLIDCSNEASWSVAILLFPPAPFKGMPGRREMPHKLCTEHAQAVSVRDFVDDEHWTDIVNTYRRKKVAVPARHRCQMSFKKYVQPTELKAVTG